MATIHHIKTYKLQKDSAANYLTLKISFKIELNFNKSRLMNKFHS